MNCISSAGQADINNTEEEAKGTAKLLAWLPTGPSVYRHSNWVSNAYLTSYAALASPSVSVCFVTPETSPSAQTQHTHTHSHIHAYLCVNKWSAFGLLYNSLANKKVSGTFFAMLIVPEDWITNNGNDCWKLKWLVFLHQRLHSSKAMLIRCVTGQIGQKHASLEWKYSHRLVFVFLLIICWRVAFFSNCQI